jgi:glycosyltransferase involved in cell wall biosynthesis
MRLMRICLPIADAPQGGMHAFFRNFRAYLAGIGADVTDDLESEYDALVVNSWVIGYRPVARAKRARPALRVLHRIDGAASLYGRDGTADTRQALVNLLADVTVFQSAWGRGATFGRGIIGLDGPVIHNPVDTGRFRPDGERVPLPGRVRVAHVAFSTNARKGAAAIWTLARRRPDLQFIMVGRYEGAPALDNLTFLGYAGWERLPAVLRACDVFLTFSENETCSNSVLEALATGLPVLYRSSGGTGELVGPCGTPVEVDTFDRALESTLDHRPALAEAARARAVTSFGVDVVFPRYLDALRAASRRSLPGPAACLGTMARVPPPAAAVGRWLAAQAWRRPALSRPA